MNYHNAPALYAQAGNPNHPAITSKLGMYGIGNEDGTVEWMWDDGYTNTLMGRVRAAVDFIDTHPELAVLVDTRGAKGYPTQRVQQRLYRDGLAGRYVCRDYGNRLVEVKVK